MTRSYRVKPTHYFAGQICPLCDQKRYYFRTKVCLSCYDKAKEFGKKIDNLVKSKVSKELKNISPENIRKYKTNPFIAVPTPKDITEIKIILVKFRRNLQTDIDYFRLCNMFMKYKRKTLKEAYSQLTIEKQIPKMIGDLELVIKYFS